MVNRKKKRWKTNSSLTSQCVRCVFTNVTKRKDVVNESSFSDLSISMQRESSTGNSAENVIEFIKRATLRVVYTSSAQYYHHLSTTHVKNQIPNSIKKTVNIKCLGTRIKTKKMVTITPMKFLKLRKMKNIFPSRRCVQPTSAGDLDGCASDEIQTGRSSASKELTRLAFVCDKMIQYLPSKK